MPRAEVESVGTRGGPRGGLARGIVIELHKHGIEVLGGKHGVHVRIWQRALRRGREEVLLARVLGETDLQLRGCSIVVRSRVLDVEIEAVENSFAEGTIVVPAYSCTLMMMIREGESGGCTLAEHVPELVSEDSADAVAEEAGVVPGGAADG